MRRVIILVGSSLAQGVEKCAKRRERSVEEGGPVMLMSDPHMASGC